MDISAALQNLLERSLEKLLLFVREKSDAQKLLYSGGVALNCVANHKLFKTKIFDKIFIPPNPGDAGVAIGAAYLASQLAMKKTNPSLLIGLLSSIS